MSAIDALLNPRHRRACTYKAVKPFLYKPKPAIELKYFNAPSTEEREEHARETDLICSQCGRKVAVLGWTNTTTGEIACDLCAIEDYNILKALRRLRRLKHIDEGCLTQAIC